MNRPFLLPILSKAPAKRSSSCNTQDLKNTHTGHSRNQVIKTMKLLSVLASSLLLTFANTNIQAQIATTEEQRVDAALTAMSSINTTVQSWTMSLTSAMNNASNVANLLRRADTSGNKLWQNASNKIRKTGNYDDRALYWSRLNIVRWLRNATFSFELSDAERNQVIAKFEHASRGFNDLVLDTGSTKQVLITGFDPFGLDNNIKQMNPSGITALMLDGRTIDCHGVNTHIEAITAPVRFHDFDDGFIETNLTPVFNNHAVDMIATVSMGRSAIDLEHFPGGRRSSGSYPDNDGITQGSFSEPLPFTLNGSPLGGPEFVESSLPINAMLNVQSPYTVNDNRWVYTLNGWMQPTTLNDVQGQIAVEGTGGGYLSNEISYRTLLLKQRLNSAIPVGHIHTPALYRFDRAAQQQIVNEVQELICTAVASL